jgi:hypothetical protein
MAKIKRYHPSVKAARKYIDAEHPNDGLRIWKNKNGKQGRKFWIGTEFEWLNWY